VNVAKSPVVDKDLGMKALSRFMHQLSVHRPSVAVGILGDKAAAAHRGTAAATVVEIGAAHEFGAGVPERSFLRRTVDAERTKYLRHMTNGLRRETGEVARSGTVPGQSVTLKRLGLMVEGDIKKLIAQGIDPALKPETIKRKGSSKPLIDTGQLRASISSEPRKGRRR